MTPEEAQKAIEASNSFSDRFHDIERTLNAERERKKARLAHLQSELPGLLAAEILGEGKNGHVAEARQEITEIEARLEEVPLIFKGLRAIEHEHNARHARALNHLRRAEAEASWEAYKKELKENYSKELAGKFRQLSRDLNRWDEARLFLEPLTENGDESTKPAR